MIGHQSHAPANTAWAAAAAAVGWPPGGLAPALHNRLLGFVKTVLMRQLVDPGAVVCDLFCGRGLDTDRWAEAKIERYIGVDLSGSALEEAREQWESHERPFAAEFCELDPCIMELDGHLQKFGIPVDVVSCLNHLQDTFTNEDIVRHLLKNVAKILKPGGFFFGTAPDSSTIWYKYQKAVEGAMKAGSLRVNGTLPFVKTELYKITFDDDRFQLFGSKYHLRFTDDGMPASAQLLVHFPTLIRLAREAGLEYVEIQNLHEFYDDVVIPFADVLKKSCENLVDSKGVSVLDARGRLNAQAVDVLSLYTTFVFKKEEEETSTLEADPSPEKPEIIEATSAASPPPVAPAPSTSIIHQYHRRHERVKEEQAVRTPSLKALNLRQDEKPRETNPNQAVDRAEDYTEGGASGQGSRWEEAQDVQRGNSERTPDAAAEQDRLDPLDYRFSEDRLRGLKKGFKEKYYTRAHRQEYRRTADQQGRRNSAVEDTQTGQTSGKSKTDNARGNT